MKDIWHEPGEKPTTVGVLMFLGVNRLFSERLLSTNHYLPFPELPWCYESDLVAMLHELRTKAAGNEQTDEDVRMWELGHNVVCVKCGFEGPMLSSNAACKSWWVTCGTGVCAETSKHKTQSAAWKEWVEMNQPKADAKEPEADIASERAAKSIIKLLENIERVLKRNVVEPILKSPPLSDAELKFIMGELTGIKTLPADAFAKAADIEADTPITAGSALDRQVGGSHYKGFTIQPVEFSERNGLTFIEGNIIKYICRYRQDGGEGVKDLRKVIDYVEKLIEMRYPEAKS